MKRRLGAEMSMDNFELSRARSSRLPCNGYFCSVARPTIDALGG